jgi:phosphopantetheinyl transferase
MPKIDIRNVSDDLSIGMWKISETVEDFFQIYPFLDVFKEEVTERYRCRARACEFLAVRALLHLMCPGSLIRYHSDGSPFLEGINCSISISHTRGYATLMMSRTKTVGIDIEYRTERVKKIKDKFIRCDEKAETIASMLIHWSAKEAVYKLFHEENLAYFDMRIQPFVQSSEGDILVENLVRKVIQRVHFSVNEDYVLTYCSK